MKKAVFFFFVYIYLISFVSAACTNYYDDGNDPDAFGYADANGVFYQDTCSSPTQIQEYYCSGSNIASETYSCGACNDGICYSSTCTIANECNPVFREWCSGSSWSSSSYCSDSNLECYLVDSTCVSSTCSEGACDYENYKYCLDNEWVSEDYCDTSHCGGNVDSLGYCFCADTDATSESDCTDDRDDDCDGNVDCHDSDCTDKEGCLCEEGDTQTCSTDEGECESGTQICSGGSWSTCSGIEPREELCDELDNDCDTAVDEDCTCVVGDTRDCGVNIGVCKAGVQVCEEDMIWSLCFGASYAASEIEDCNGQDDDCDGNIDEGCGCVSNTTQSCGSDVGACQVGFQNCINGTWGDCMENIDSFPEICGDLIDNDCDDHVDSDDATCAEEVVNLTDSIEEPAVEEEAVPECSRDGDCEKGLVCVRAECVQEVEIDTSGGLESSLHENESRSLLLEKFSYEKDSLFVSLFFFFLVLLFVFCGVFWYVRRKRRTLILQKKNSSPLPGSVLRPAVSLPLRSAPLRPQRKGSLDQKLEKSFKESSLLFRK